MGARVDSLWRQSNFLRFWIGLTSSVLGKQVALTAIPLAAAVTLQASAGQMGLLLAAAQLPGLLLTLPAGVWIDRLRRRPILISADVGRALFLATIPVAALLGVLQLELLYVVSFLAGVCQAFYDVGERTFLPVLVERERLTDGNAKLGIGRSIAEGGGPGLAGFLVQVLGPSAVAFSSVLFAISALCVRSIRTVERPVALPTSNRDLRGELAEGLRFLLRDPALRPLTLCASTYQLCFNALMAVFVLYVTRSLGIEPSGLGLILAVGAPGFLLGALLAERIARRIGWGPTMVVSAAVITSFPLLIPLAGAMPSGAALLLALTRFAMMLSAGVFSTHYYSFCQTVVPARLLGRVIATNSFVSLGMMPVGSLIGGALGEMLGVPLTVLAAAAATPLAMAWLVFSPVWRLRSLPDAEATPVGAHIASA